MIANVPLDQFGRAWTIVNAEWRRRQGWGAFAEYFGSTWISERNGWSREEGGIGCPTDANFLESTWPLYNRALSGAKHPSRIMDILREDCIKNELMFELEISKELKPLSSKETHEAVLFAVPQTRVRSLDKCHFYVHADRVGIDDTHVAAYERAMSFPDDLTYDELRAASKIFKFNDTECTCNH
jgi:hypothetical protein